MSEARDHKPGLAEPAHYQAVHRVQFWKLHVLAPAHPLPLAVDLRRRWFQTVISIGHAKMARCSTFQTRKDITLFSFYLFQPKLMVHPGQFLRLCCNIGWLGWSAHLFHVAWIPFCQGWCSKPPGHWVLRFDHTWRRCSIRQFLLP